MKYRTYLSLGRMHVFLEVLHDYFSQNGDKLKFYLTQPHT